MGILGGKIKQELGLSKLGTIRYRTASGSDRPVVSSDFFNNERAGRYRSRFCNDKLLLARITSSRTAHNDSRYGDPFIASVQDDTRHLDELAEGC